MGFAWSNFPCSLQTPQNMVQCSWYLPYIHDHHLRLTIIESTHFCEAPHIIEAESKIKAALVTGNSPCSLYCCIFPSLALKYWPGHDGEEDGEALTCSCKFLMHCTSISFNGFTNTCSMSSPSHSRCTTWQHLSMNSLHWQRQHHQQQEQRTSHWTGRLGNHKFGDRCCWCPCPRCADTHGEFPRPISRRCSNQNQLRKTLDLTAVVNFHQFAFHMPGTLRWSSTQKVQHQPWQ